MVVTIITIVPIGCDIKLADRARITVTITTITIKVTIMAIARSKPSI